jgi:hypothetical protein
VACKQIQIKGAVLWKMELTIDRVIIWVLSGRATCLKLGRSGCVDCNGVRAEECVQMTSVVFAWEHNWINVFVHELIDDRYSIGGCHAGDRREK